MSEKAPKHVGLIMDGNGRWASSRNKPRFLGHKEGVEVVKTIATHAADCGIECLTLFAFSMENWLRPKDEVTFLLDLLDEYLDRELNTLIEKNMILRISGKTELVPEKIQKKMQKAVEKSASNTGMILNLAISYGGRAEIVDAAKELARRYSAGEAELDNFNNDDFAKLLYNPDIPDIDLIIRTSGEERISNFMLWRAAYSELYFTDTYWPDFTTADFDAALEDYAGRQRRFGKTDEQMGNR